MVVRVLVAVVLLYVFAASRFGHSSELRSLRMVEDRHDRINEKHLQIGGKPLPHMPAKFPCRHDFFPHAHTHYLSLSNGGLPEMFAGQFDTSSAFNGGGFMSSQSTEATDPGASIAKNRETHGLVPVTIKQISEASHSGDDKSNFVIDGVDVTNVTLIGIVSEKAKRVTDVAFAIDDGTGRIDCHRWANETFDTKEMEEIQDGMYVRVIGHLKSFQGRRQLVPFSVRPVTNFDEISFHFIECIHFHLQNSRTRLRGDTTAQYQYVNPSLNNAAQDVSNGYQTTPTNHFSGQYSVDGLKGFDQMVLDYLQQPSNFGREKGVHRDELSQKLKIPMEKIPESIRTLEEEGLIYSTFDGYIISLFPSPVVNSPCAGD